MLTRHLAISPVDPHTSLTRRLVCSTAELSEHNLSLSTTALRLSSWYVLLACLPYHFHSNLQMSFFRPSGGGGGATSHLRPLWP